MERLRPLWIGAGVVSLGLGLAGIPLPLLPTTPFILLSAFCFARGSQRLHGWLMSHPRFGPTIRDWNRNGAISLRARKLAATAMATALLLSFAISLPWTILAVQAAVLGERPSSF
ncbi:YbaN family protein [Mesorhizobium sp. VNQ89]|uniref:YbaN family protein n=1 Tax=Mesorhizobium quangtriensis TaxID=3157709 RepID=UPI0032B85BF3